MSTVHMWWPADKPERGQAAIYDCTVPEAWQAIAAEGAANGHETRLLSTTRPLDGGPPREIHGVMVVELKDCDPMTWVHVVAEPTSGWGGWVEKVKEGTA